MTGRKIIKANLIRAAQSRAAAAGNPFAVHRFKGSGHTKAGREAAWLAFRAKGVGGSDMSTILGLNQWATPYDLWLEKTGRRAPEDISGKWAIVKGNALEIELRRRFRDLHPELVVVDGTGISIASDAHPCMHASLDGWLYDPESDSFGVLEIKTANASRGRMDWHDENGELRIPDYYMAQVTHYLAVTGFEWGYVYADIGEAEPIEVRFERDEQDVKAVTNAAEEFWGYVQRDEMPTLTAPDVAKAYPEPAEGVETVDDDDTYDLLAQYEAAQTRLKEAKEDVAALKDAIIVLIGDRQGIRCDNIEATYKPYTRKAYTRVVEASSGRRFGFRVFDDRKEDK